MTREEMIAKLRIQIDDVRHHGQILTLEPDEAENIIALLDVEKTVIGWVDTDGVPRCGFCGGINRHGCKYCDECGKPLDWE